jgi:hypothetical protein
MVTLAIWWLTPRAEGAVKRCADVLGPPGRGLDPGPQNKGRAMAHMLAMKARQVGHPISNLVLPEPGDFSLHPPIQPDLVWAWGRGKGLVTMQCGSGGRPTIASRGRLGSAYAWIRHVGRAA